MIDVTAVVSCCNDEERIGHLVRRLAEHLTGLGLRFEILAIDEGSTDNTVALLTLIRRGVPQLEVVAGVNEGRGLIRGAKMARGRHLMVLDAGCDPVLSALGFALARLDGEASCDVVTLPGGVLLMRRTRSWRAFDALLHRRDAVELARRFIRKARTLGLQVHLPESSRPNSAWARLRDLLLAPLAS